MKIKLQYLILISITLIIGGCSLRKPTPKEIHQEIISEVILNNEYSEHFSIRSIQTINKNTFENFYTYEVFIDVDENMFDEYNPIEVERVINSIPLVIDEQTRNKFLSEQTYEIDYTIEIEELKIYYDKYYRKTKDGIFTATSKFDPVAELESYERMQESHEEFRKNQEENKGKVRRFDAQMMINGNTYVFTNKTREEINDEYRRIYSESMKRRYPNVKGGAAPPIDWSKVYFRREYKN